jgi:hypothetical protein
MNEQMDSFSVAIEGLLYKMEGSTASTSGWLSGNSALPPRVVCHSGLSFEVTSLGGRDAVFLFSICIPSSVLRICENRFILAVNLCYVAFEFDSRVFDVTSSAFQLYRALKSICIPSRVEAIGKLAFRECYQLSGVMFERDSRLSSIGEWGFYDCASLKSIFLPGSLARLEGWALPCQYLESVSSIFVR